MRKMTIVKGFWLFQQLATLKINEENQNIFAQAGEQILGPLFSYFCSGS